jgi:hypothetical protein
MESISLRDYIKSRPKEKDTAIINMRACTLCRKLDHFQNMAFVMASKIQGYGSVSFIFCVNCIPNWKKAFLNGRISSPDEWHFSTWNLDKSPPHTEVDKICLYLKRNQLYLQVDCNPSRRERNMIPEEIR